MAGAKTAERFWAGAKMAGAKTAERKRLERYRWRDLKSEILENGPDGAISQQHLNFGINNLLEEITKLITF